MSADVGSSEAEAARNARLHALCSRPMRLIPAFPLSSGEAETGIKALSDRGASDEPNEGSAAPLASGHSGVIAVVVERFDLVN